MTRRAYAWTAALVLVTVVGLIWLVQSWDDIRSALPHI